MPALPPVEYLVSFVDGPGAEWQLLRFVCDEETDGGCRIMVELAIADFDEDLDSLLGATLNLEAWRGEVEAHFFGVVHHVELLGHAEHRCILLVHAMSAFELCEQRVHSRIFQEKSVVDIVQEVLDEALGEYGRSVELGALSRGQSPREYCVQYLESDFDFVRRLLEEEGISYYFAHDPGAGHEVMTLCDANDQYPAAANIDGSDEFPLIERAPDLVTLESVQSLEWSQRLTRTASLRQDFDWLSPGAVLSSEAGEADARGRTRRVFVHGLRRYHADDLGERAQDRVEAGAMDSSTAFVVSNALALRPGMRFRSDAHADDGCPGEYIIRSLHHEGGGDIQGGLGEDEQVRYANELRCLDAELPLRPVVRTPKPRIHGAQTATVVGGGEIHTDAHGRIQVQFHWEEGAGFAEGASCWVRCAQSWAGPSWGAQFIPRVGMEVVVDFLDGNPDRPLVVGCVYNGENAPPFELPGNSTQSGWRTNSSPGGGGSNELRFEDAAGIEQIYIHGQKDWLVEIENDTARHTGNDELHTVGHDYDKRVDNNQSETVAVDKSISVGSNHTETIGATMSLTVGTSQTVTIGTTQTISVGTALTETVGATATQLVAAAKTTTVGGAFTIAVGAAMSTAVGAASTEVVAGAKSVAVGATSDHTVAGSYSLGASTISQSAKTSLQLSAGTELMGKGEKKVAFTSDGPIESKAKTKYTVDAGDEFTITCGSSSLTMKKNGTIEIKGKTITINGSSKLNLKGGKIHEN